MVVEKGSSPICAFWYAFPFIKEAYVRIVWTCLTMVLHKFGTLIPPEYCINGMVEGYTLTCSLHGLYQFGTAFG